MSGVPLSRIKGLVFALALVAVLSVSQFSKVGERYMVRAIFLRQSGDWYTVGVLYQNPESAANSAEVQAPFQFASGEGTSLSAAFQAVEQGVSVSLSYQRSDYLLLSAQCSKDALAAYALQVQTTQQGRYAAQVYYLENDMDDVAQLISSCPDAAQNLLDYLEAGTGVTAHLYDVGAETLPMPLVSLGADGVVAAEQRMYLLSEHGAGEYNTTQTQLYSLLCGAQSECVFLAGDVAFSVGQRVLSYQGALQGVWDGHLACVSEETDLVPLTIYALVSDATDDSAVSLANMEAYLTYLGRSEPELLALAGVSEMKVHLVSLSNLL